MNRSVRSIAASLAAAMCLWPVAAGAQEVQPVPSSGLTVEQARGVFADAGFQVDQPLSWDWTSPPVSSFRVYDQAQGRILLVLVYPSVAAAQAGRLQAEAYEQVDRLSSGTGPALVVGFGESVWRGNVALVQTTPAQLAQADRLQADRDNGQYVEPGPATPSSRPVFAVDVDFLQALNNGAANL
jgi:hypothetical protein